MITINLMLMLKIISLVSLSILMMSLIAFSFKDEKTSILAFLVIFLLLGIPIIYIVAN